VTHGPTIAHVRYGASVFCLVTWNVLADSYVQRRFYPHSPRAVLARGARTQAIVHHLAASPADLACLQEIEPPLVEAVVKSGSWRVEFAPKRGKPDGVALLARNAVTLADVATVAFADGSGHVALLATVHVAGARLCRVATTHLRWDPHDTPYAQRWAVREASELLALLGSTERVILCGDLNIEPTDAVYDELLAAGLVDAYAGAPAPTANPNGRAKRIDHILCGTGLVATALPVLPIDDDTPLPSRALPSDHVPIGARISA
jgi:mRNA deadenylase 3'-5' endonuclease subunit Ccr4